jgi:hypothetical protein
LAGLLAEVLAHAADIVKTTVGARTVEGGAAWCVAAPTPFEFWKVALHSPGNRFMGHADPPIRHHDHQIPQAQFEARVPAYAQDDDLSVEVPPSEQIFDRDELLHLFIIAPRVCTRAVLRKVAITSPGGSGATLRLPEYS